MPSADQEVEEFRQRVGRMARLFDGLLDRVALVRNISRADWSALSVVIRSVTPCTPTELGRILELTSGTVSTRIKRLTAAGLIEAASDSGDARSRPIKATAIGYEVWADATAVRTHEEAKVIRSSLADTHLSAVNKQLAQILAALEREFGSAGSHDISPRDRDL